MSSVSLNKESRKLKTGQRVEYWYLRWYGSDGKRRAKCIGRCDDISKTKAYRIRLRKMSELEMSPGQADLDGPRLEPFLAHYLRSRTDLQPSSLLLKEQTSRYLRAYFGDKRLIGKITKSEARDFTVALGEGKLAHASKQPWKLPGTQTVTKHILNAHAIFNRAVAAHRDGL